MRYHLKFIAFFQLGMVALMFHNLKALSQVDLLY